MHPLKEFGEFLTPEILNKVATSLQHLVDTDMPLPTVVYDQFLRRRQIRFLSFREFLFAVADDPVFMKEILDYPTIGQELRSYAVRYGDPKWRGNG